MLRPIIGPVLTILVLVVITFVGGQLNTTTANGTVIDDWNGKPISGAQVAYGSRSATSADDGSWTLGLVPRGARLSAVQRQAGYGSADFGADQHEVRLTPATLNVVLKDTTTGQGVHNPRAQKDQQQIGQCDDTNSQPCANMIIAPHPGKDVQFIVCAKDYETKTVQSDTVILNVDLGEQKGNDCPPLPTPSPSPGASESPSPSPSGSASPAPSPTPTPTPAP